MLQIGAKLLQIGAELLQIGAGIKNWGNYYKSVQNRHLEKTTEQNFPWLLGFPIRFMLKKKNLETQKLTESLLNQKMGIAN